MRHVISLLMENEPGALSRVVGLFSQRGYNIETLNVAPTEDNTLSRLTLSTIGDDKIITQICSHLDRLLDVVQVDDLSSARYVERELVLLKFRVGDEAARRHLEEALGQFAGEIVEETQEVYIVQLTGDDEQLGAFIQAAGEKEMIEMVRSGVCGINLDDRPSSSPED